MGLLAGTHRGKAARLSSRNSFSARWQDSSWVAMLDRRSSTRGSDANDTTLPLACVQSQRASVSRGPKLVLRLSYNVNETCHCMMHRVGGM